MFNSLEIIDIAINFEKNGERVYREAVGQVNDPEIISLLEWMADEEVQHAKWFEELKKTAELESKDFFVEQVGSILLSEMLGEQDLSLKEVDFSAIEQMNDLLEIFIEFERDTIIFYEIIQPFLEDETAKQHLEKIISEENHHVQRLQAFIESDAAIPIAAEK